jgi:serine O-acetyltransferase
MKNSDDQSLIKKQIATMLMKQVTSLFSDLTKEESKEIQASVDNIFPSIKNCIKKTSNRHFTRVNPLNSNQYAIILYKIAKNLSLTNLKLADIVYYLNKTLNSVDVYHAVILPEIFSWEHPLGSVLGKAKYGEYFVIYQSCTVGGNFDKNNKINYPQIGSNVTMFSYSCILGKCKIGNNVIISSQTYIKDQDIPDNSIVFGSSPNLIIKENKKTLNFFIN